MEADAFLHKRQFRSEEWSTSSGETSTGEYGDTRNGDCDDTISLCSWTTDQGDPGVTVPSHASPYCTPYCIAPMHGPISGNWHDGVATAPDGVPSGNWQDGSMSGTIMPQGSWYGTPYVPTWMPAQEMPTQETQWAVVVMPRCSIGNGNGNAYDRVPQQ